MARALKDSGVPWIGEIPSTWNIMRLKFATIFVAGFAFKTDDFNNIGENVIKIGDIKPPSVVLSENAKVDISSYNAGKLLPYKVKNGDYCIAMTGATIGKVGLVNFKETAYINQRVAKITTKDNFHSKYLYYYLCSQSFAEYIKIHIDSNSAQPNISNGTMQEFQFFLPNINEQIVIINFLDKKCGKIEALVENEEKIIDELKEYKKSIIQKTVTKGLSNAPLKDSNIEWIGKIPENWEVRKLKYLGSARNGLTYSPADMTDEGILVLRSSNIQDGSLSFNDNVFVNMQIPEELILQENDLLICSRNGSRELIGKCALIDEKTAGNTFGAFMCIFRSQYNRFIYYVFQSNLFTFYLGNYLTATVNQLTISNLNNMEIPITLDLEEQKAIVNYLDEKCGQIDSLIKIKQKKISELKEYKKSLIYEYVTGKKQPPLKDKI